MVTIFIDSRYFPWAESYFIWGIENIFGKENIVYNNTRFANIADDERGKHTLNFIVEKNGVEKKYCIDWFDMNTIWQGAYKWCDVYGKVNTNWKVTPKEKFTKLISIGPSMGIKTLSMFEAISRFINIAVKSHILFSKDSVRYARYYYREFNRLPLTDYVYNPSMVQNGYIFFLSTLWYNAQWNNNDENLNTPRYNMMKMVKNLPDIYFEGGLVPHNSRNNRNGYTSSTDKYSDLLYSKRIPISEYINKVQRSFVVLNTPAVVSCHGWKLAEYLALGKCIISLPLVNDLPYPLKHGENIHFVDGSLEDIEQSIIFIYKNPAYRIKLEKGARKYFEEWCAPDIALKLMNL